MRVIMIPSTRTITAGVRPNENRTPDGRPKTIVPTLITLRRNRRIAKRTGTGATIIPNQSVSSFQLLRCRVGGGGAKPTSIIRGCPEARARVVGYTRRSARLTQCSGALTIMIGSACSPYGDGTAPWSWVDLWAAQVPSRSTLPLPSGEGTDCG
jgi:hypothetical protein